MVNGDFASFDGWTGQLFDGGSSPLVDDALLHPDNRFGRTIGGGMAELANDATYYEVYLYQSFILPSNATTISFDFD